MLNQTYNNFELIMADNASTDSTNRIAFCFAPKDKRIKLYGYPHHCGKVLWHTTTMDEYPIPSVNLLHGSRPKSSAENICTIYVGRIALMIMGTPAKSSIRIK